ncbi:signal recognition particle-docking protein FtsY [Fluviicoccus keumensis]|uniref:Signal recognition particle receptor FtsY n=1 Tax=Fluviicoccus keumensis TaxID=1435465 RepID=A0A4Q7ZAK8_9GAMM|nr:signal recognition particle-docking protein FtsY [Fluviicoccus keumensis]RZU46935.1 signal recognition particle-docking protein FtsY [Fluviicoccus keumensis]
MSEHDNPADAKTGSKSWFSWKKPDNGATPAAADETPISVPDDETADWAWEGSTDVTLPSLPAVDVPIIENPRSAPVADAVTAPSASLEEEHPHTPGSGSSFFSRMKSGLSRTRDTFTNGMVTLLIGGKEIDDELLEEIETQMLVADMGVEATRTIIGKLTERVSRKELTHSNGLYKALQEELVELLAPRVKPLHIDPAKRPYVILMVGVNGVGKTTTIGKLAKRLQKEGKKVMLAAGDTFRAAAVEQLQVWGERNNIAVVAQGTGADSASVAFDALQSARAKDVDVLIIDTAGRLHTKSNLMEELKKVKRVIQKLDGAAPHEAMLVVDAGTGQNAIAQVQEFDQAVGLTGLTITKLDGTAKGGVLFNIASRTHVPIRYIGVGEKIDDLRPFVAKEFVAALFQTE